VYQPGDSRWGLESLVGMIEHAAKVIRKQYPDSQLSVGHLSRPGGGEIDRHASHESGRDADIGFYVRNQQGKTIYADHFVPFKGDGTATSWPGAQFDDAKNWALVNSIVSDPNARVTHIFVASPIRARLLQYAEKIGAPAAARTRAAELMAQPRGALPHDDHFHVRISCPPGSTDLTTNKCVEVPLPHHRSSPLAKAAHSGKPKPAKRAPKPSPAPAKPEDDDKEDSKDDSKESFLPSLAPTIPGLDTAIIPKLLVDPSKKAEPPSSIMPLEPLPPIDDPDGVYENR
jgi:penicillin-insensitive murein endopeptidase